MNPIEELKHEHQIILMVLKGARRQAESDPDIPVVEEMLDFFRNFADKCHHAKEERLLFKKMEERGFASESGPIAVMLHEHNLGRAFLKAVAEGIAAMKAGDDGGKSAVRNGLGQYAVLLDSHIYKEDHMLYPMAEKVFTPEDHEELARAFEKVEKEEIGVDIREKYHEMAHRLRVHL